MYSQNTYSDSSLIMGYFDFSDSYPVMNCFIHKQSITQDTNLHSLHLNIRYVTYHM